MYFRSLGGVSKSEESIALGGDSEVSHWREARAPDLILSTKGLSPSETLV